MKVLTCVGRHQFSGYPGIDVDDIPPTAGEGVPLFPNPLQIWRRIESIRSYRGTPDVIIVEAFGGAYFRGPLRRMIKRDYERLIMTAVLGIARRTRAKLVVLDLSDDLTIHPVNRPLLAACDLYFKRELAVDPWRSLESFHGGTCRTATLGFRPAEANQRMVRKLRPMSLGFNNTEETALEIAATRGIPGESEKTVDLVYIGNDWCRPLRESARSELSAVVSGKYRFDIPEEKLDFHEFASRIRRSWLCLSPPGFGWDCHRHYEAALFGAVPVLSNPDIQMHEGFEHGKNALFYNPSRPLLPQIEPWLDKREALLRMAAAAKQHVLEHHTLQARSKVMVGQPGDPG